MIPGTLPGWSGADFEKLRTDLLKNFEIGPKKDDINMASIC